MSPQTLSPLLTTQGLHQAPHQYLRFWAAAEKLSLGSKLGSSQESPYLFVTRLLSLIIGAQC